MNLLQMSFSGAAFITAVVIIRAVAINKLPKKTFLVLWELVILRLLIPFSIPSMFSVYTLVTHSISSTTLPEVEQITTFPLCKGCLLRHREQNSRQRIFYHLFPCGLLYGVQE